MSYIPAGKSRYSYDGNYAVPAFCMDILETTVAEYKQCVRAEKCNRARKTFEADGFSSSYWRKGNGRVALDCVDFDDAEAYCRYRQKRLPTPTEWFRAADGDRDVRDPWGDTVIAAGGVCWQRTMKQGPCEVGTSLQDVSLFGIKDMGANTDEWTSAPDSDFVKGGAPTRSEAVLGYSWADRPNVIGASTTRPRATDITNTCAGIRCARDPEGDGER
jgi:formylglycine-generating enzyme required for sulfatase activity